MANTPSSDPVRSRYPSSTLQNLTDELLRDQSASMASQSNDGACFGRASSSHDYPRQISSESPDNPLRPKPLAFSPKSQPPSVPTSPAQQEPPANWGDYHGGAYVKSPTGSLASHFSKSTMKSRNSVKAPRSMSRSSRPEPYREGRPLDSPMVTALPTSPERSQSMFSFDEGQQSEREFFTGRRASDRQYSQQSHHDEPLPPIPPDYLMPGSPERGPSNASTIPGSVFRDFDGVHLEEVDEEPEHSILEEEAEETIPAQEVVTEEPVQNAQAAIAADPNTEATQTQEPVQSDAETWFNQARQEAADALAGGHAETTAPVAAMDHGEDRDDTLPLQSAPDEHPQPRHQRRWKEPPPTEGMVYYPAPVPRILNLPKRLSQMPDLSLQAQRRSQMISTLPDENRRSVAWLSARKSQDNLTNMRSDSPDEERGRSRRKQPANAKNLPPQLRASLFFDQPAIENKIELKRGSAMLTFEEMLDASTTAPVTAFTGITDAYVPQGRGRTTSMMMTDGRPESRHSRGSRLSMIMAEGKSDGRASRASMLSGKRSKSFDRLAAKRSSSVLDASRGGVRIVQSEDGLSRLDFEPEAEEEDDAADEQSKMLEHQSDDEGVIRVPGQIPQGEEQLVDDELAQLDNEDDEDISGPPTTLLAELQMRKAKLKQRTRTAANAFPRGMHSTLLELEAVAQVEKRKRQNKRTALAWEDPNGGVGQPAAVDVDDDDVPLGMLFPERQGLASKAGQRDWNNPMGLMEQREHQQHEQNESLMARRNRLLGIKPAPPPPQAQPEEDQSEHGDETLAQRTRRLQTSKALDDAIGVGSTIHNRAVSDDFASEMMSQFGGLDRPAEKPKPTTKQPLLEPEEETLGQRRKRLQAEALARGVSTQQVRQSTLTSAPGRGRDFSGSTGPSVATSGLLHDAQNRRAREKAHILEQNTKSGLGIGLGSHLVDIPTYRNMPQIYQPTAGAAMATRSGQGWGIPAHNFAQGFGAIQAHPRGSMLWAAQEDRRAREASNAYPRQISGQLSLNPTYAAGAQQGPMLNPETMSPVQRETIDKWRQSVMM